MSNKLNIFLYNKNLVYLTDKVSTEYWLKLFENIERISSKFQAYLVFRCMM